ncbi:MAG: Rieske (2Fe-2S) protein, partial [Chloroflexia bacterium]|nr:Rieske (2Fe-2S) protein [Chloroflexia bacterium]
MAAPILSSPPSLASPVSAAEVAGVRRPTTEAHMLPPRVFHDPMVLAYEREAWFADEWVCVGREEDFPQAGSYHLVRVAGQRLVVIRGGDGQIRAFHNLCRHRGATLLTEPCGTLVRFQCPYHAWIYDLEGRLRQPRHTDTLIDFD